MNEIIESTRRLEPALRYLSNNANAKVSVAAVKYKVSPAALWAWLGAHNQARPHPPKHIIDNCLVAPDPVKKMAPVKPSLFGVSRIVSPPLVGPTAEFGKWLEGQNVTVRDRATTFLIEVTPAVATSWLRLNLANRKPSQAKIRRFAAAMKSGRWAQNGETVKFSSTGRLIDGQSRLLACVAAEVPVVLEVRAGLPDVAQQSMDSGELRSGAHTLEMLGEKYPQILAPALKLLWLEQAGRLGGAQNGRTAKMENSDLAPVLAKHPGLKASVGWVMTKGARLAQMVAPSMAAFFHYRFGVLPKQRDAFFEALSDGIGLTKLSPIYHLREQLLADRAERIVKSRTTQQRALFIKAWNAHCAKQRCEALAHRVTDAFPEILPKAA